MIAWQELQVPSSLLSTLFSRLVPQGRRFYSVPRTLQKRRPTPHTRPHTSLQLRARPLTRAIAMASSPAGVEQLAGLVSDLTLESAAEKYPNCYPKSNPLDFVRAHLSDVLSGITGVDAKIIYPALSWTTGLDKGDFALPAPALRIKGKKPDELAQQWAAAVCTSIAHEEPWLTRVVPRRRPPGQQTQRLELLPLILPQDGSPHKVGYFHDPTTSRELWRQ